jgi:hypothetical protein
MKPRSSDSGSRCCQPSTALWTSAQTAGKCCGAGARQMLPCHASPLPGGAASPSQAEGQQQQRPRGGRVFEVGGCAAVCRRSQEADGAGAADPSSSEQPTSPRSALDASLQHHFDSIQVRPTSAWAASVAACLQHLLCTVAWLCRQAQLAGLAGDCQVPSCCSCGAGAVGPPGPGGPAATP